MLESRREVARCRWTGRKLLHSSRSRLRCHDDQVCRRDGLGRIVSAHFPLSVFWKMRPDGLPDEPAGRVVSRKSVVPLLRSGRKTVAGDFCRILFIQKSFNAL